MTRSPPEDELSGVLGRWYAVRALVSLEWLPAILVALADGPKYYTELLKEASALHLASGWSNRYGQLHESTLTRTLKQLAQDGLIERHEKREAFITTVRYSLTVAAEQLLDAILPVSDWAHQHNELIVRARHRRDEISQAPVRTNTSDLRR